MRTLLILTTMSCALASGCGDSDGDRHSRATPTATETPLRSISGSGSPTPTVTPPVAILAGVYDATITRASNSSVQISSTGRVSIASDGNVDVSVRVGSDRSFEFFGLVGVNGTIRGDGSLLVTDEAFLGTGEAVFSDRAGIQTVTGSFRTDKQDGFDSEDDTFVLLRPEAADATVFNGSYRFAFIKSPSFCDCPSTIDVDFSFEASGGATVTATVEHDQHGATLARLTGIGAQISPNGQLEASFGYEPMTDLPLDRLMIFGELHRSGTSVSGEGEVFVGGITADLNVGPWSVERLP